MERFTIYLLYFISFVDLFGVGLLIPLIGNHVRGLGASQTIVGLMGSLYSGLQLISGPLIGSLSDVRGRKSILFVCLCACSAAYLLIGFTSSIHLLLLLRVILGTFKQTQMLTKALVPDYEPDQRRQSEIYGKMAAVSGGGFVLGPVIGGHVMEDFPGDGFRLNSVLCALLFLVNAACLWFLQPQKEKKKKSPSTKKNATSLLSGVKANLRQSVAEMRNVEWAVHWDAFLFKALVGLCMGIYYSIYPVFLKSQFELSPKQIGYTISFQGVVGSMCSCSIGYINSFYGGDHDYTLRNMHCFVLMTGSLLGMGAAWNLWSFVPWLIPLAVSNAVGRLVTLEMILKKSSERHRGALIGASNSVRSVAGVLAPVLAGALTDHCGLATVLHAATTCSLLGLAFSIAIRNQSKELKID